MNTVRTSAIIFRRSMRYTLRNPTWIISGLLQPLLYLTFFGPILGRLSQVPGFGGNSWRVFIPGLLVQQVVFASVFVGIGVIVETRSGVLDRMKVSAASEAGLLTGRMLRDVTVLAVQSGLLVLGALVAGLRASVGGVLLAFVVLSVLGMAMSALSYGLALRLRTEEVFGQVVNTFMLPLLLLSGVLLPLTLAPAWLADIAEANPLSHIVTAERDLFAGRGASSSVLLGSTIVATLACLTVWFGLRSIRGSRR